MAVSRAQREATARYEAKAYDKILIRLKRGRKAEIEERAATAGESVNAYVIKAIESRMSAPALALDLSSSDGPTLAAITAAAQREGMSVNEWILDAIRDKL